MNQIFLLKSKSVLKSTSLLTCLALMLFLAACDTNTSDSTVEDTELAALSASISDELGLSASQQERVEGVFAGFGERRNRSAGFMWELAAELQTTLTEEEKEALFEGTAEAEGGLSFRGLLGFPGSGGYYGLGGFMGGRRGGGISPVDDVLNLTEDQEAALEEIHTRYRESFVALRDAFENGEISEDELVAAIISQREAKQIEILEVLTDEQEAALEEFRAEREARFEAFREEVNAVRNEVLGLSEDQAMAYDALHEEQLETRESLIEQLQAGAITAAAFEAEIELLEEARQDVLVSFLDGTQYEIVQIHDALTVRSGRFGHRGMRSGFGRGGGFGHTFGS